MSVLIHEFPLPGSQPCGSVAEHDGFTARVEDVTCEECLDRQRGATACPSRSVRHGCRCAGQRGHGGLHHAEADGRAHAWTDETSPELSIDLRRPT